MDLREHVCMHAQGGGAVKQPLRWASNTHKSAWLARK